MLGFRAVVKVYGITTERGISTAKVVSGLSGVDTVYVLLKEPIKNSTIPVIVVALAYGKDNKVKRVITAPERRAVFYEPEIRFMLGSIKGLSFDRIICLYEKSCGAVVFNKLHRLPRVLLVKNRNGKYWSFPKGHVEYGETEIETAKREVKEETGLSVIDIEGFREISDYCPFGKIRKRVVLFLAEAYSEKVRIQESEIDYYIWVSFKEAKNMCCYDNDKKVLAKAERIMRYI